MTGGRSSSCPRPCIRGSPDQEVAALIAVIRAAPRVGEAVSGIEWGPIGRFALATGGIPSALDRIEEFRIRQPFDTGPATAAGRRLAATICSECHGADLTGGQPTPDEAAPDLAIAGAYDLAQFTRLLRTGRPPNGRDLGLMREVAETDLKYLNDAEIAATLRLSAGAGAARSAIGFSGLPSGRLGAQHG